MHLTGLRGMPRRVFEYPQAAGWETLNFISSVGGFIMTIGFALVALDLIMLIRHGKPFRRDPWEAGTLEWATPTPPPSYNFGSLPHIDVRADALEPRRLGPELAAGRGYLGFMRNGWMETLTVDMVSGQVDHVVILPRPTFLPLWTAIATASFFASLLAKIYWLTPVALLAVIILFFLWTPDTGLKQEIGPLEIGRGERALHHQEVTSRPRGGAWSSHWRQTRRSTLRWSSAPSSFGSRRRTGPRRISTSLSSCPHWSPRQH